MLFRCILTLILLLASIHVRSQAPDDAEAPAAENEREVLRLRDMTAAEAEWQMDIPVFDAPADPALELDVALPDADRNARLLELVREVGLEGPDGEAADRLDRLLDEVRSLALGDVERGDFAAARQRSAVLRALDPTRSVDSIIARAVQERAADAAAARRVDEAVAAGRLIDPVDASVLVAYRALLDRNPPAALVEPRRAAVIEMAERRFEQALNDDDPARADRILAAMRSQSGLSIPIDDWQQRLDRAAAERFDRWRRDAEAALAAGDAEQVDALLARLAALDVDGVRVQALRTDLDRVRRYGRFRPGEILSDPLSDGGRGPLVVVVPAGRDTLGAAAVESGSSGFERPRYAVEFARGFALAQTEVTVAQFQAFVDATGYTTRAEQAGSAVIYEPRTGELIERNGVSWQRDFTGRAARGEAPVVHVSHADAQAYADWLSAQTGARYRLPTESEFEYALRAGSDGPYWWTGSERDGPLENLAGEGDRFGRGLRWTDAFDGIADGHWGPAPVGRFEPNPFGLLDLGGNVTEWTADCWTDDHRTAPSDGTARSTPVCDQRTVRGGAWSDGPARGRSAHRLAADPDRGDPRIGFRVVREIE